MLWATQAAAWLSLAGLPTVCLSNLMFAHVAHHLNQECGSCSIGLLLAAFTCGASIHCLLDQGSTCIHWQAALCGLHSESSSNLETFRMLLLKKVSLEATCLSGDGVGEPVS